MPEEALQIAEKRREVKGKGEKEKYTYLNAEFQRIARRDKKAFLSDHCKEIEENNRMGKTRDLLKNTRDTKGTLQADALPSEPPGKPRETKGKGENKRYTYLSAEFQRIARRDKKAFLGDQCKEIEENNRMGKTRDPFKKIRNTKGTFHAKMAQ